jgi:hypothetical protein
MVRRRVSFTGHRRVLLALAASAVAPAACAGHRPRATTAPGGNDVTLYRDGAQVRQRVELDVPASGTAVIRVAIPAALGIGDVVAFPEGGATVTGLRFADAVAMAAAPTEEAEAEELAPPREVDPQLAEALDQLIARADPGAGQPAQVELTVRAPPGHAALRLGYVTKRLTWQAAYTLTANPSRDRASLRGALAIRNATGVALPGAAVRLVDAPLADARTRAAGELLASLTGRPSPTSAAGPPAARELGRLDLADGDTRVELLRDTAPRPMRSVLVYDPIGTKYDRPGREPLMERDLGVREPAGRRVDESFEVQRDPRVGPGLPAGPVRLLERRADGSLAPLGQARLFEDTARAAASDTITVGTAGDVTGARERRELTVDTLRQRLVEEFVITIENGRPYPVEVVVREHLYRGTNWTLAYLSVPFGNETKEGPQQVAPRITVPPRAKGRVMYAVVYTW